MTKQDICIGIIDIDAQFRSSMKESLEKEGYAVLFFNDIDQALSSIKLRKFHVFILECLTQKMSLNNIAQKLHDQSPDSIFIFISQILEKSAARDAMSITRSQYFFKKPLQPQALIQIIKEKFADQVAEEYEPIIEALHSPQLTPQERIHAIQSIQSIHGFEVPRLLSYLNRAQFDGTLKLKATDNDTPIVHFQKGSISKVEVNDPKSFFGALLVDKNYVSLEELELVLQNKSTKRIGERLIDSNLVSPHIIDIINIEQLGIRLGYMIKNISYELEIKQESQPQVPLLMDSIFLSRFISDWLNSKISIDWLRSFYLPFLDKKIMRGNLFADISPIHTFYPLNKMNRFAQEITKGVSIDQILESKQFQEEDVLKGIHLLLSQEFIYFDKQTRPSDHKAHIERLQKIKNQMDKQNLFETLGLNEKSKAKEIKKAYYELSKLFHPDKVPTQAPKELSELTTAIFAKISKANEVLSDDNLRATYLKELEKGFAEKILESESHFEEGKSLLKSNQASKALLAFEKAMSLRPPTSEMQLHAMWAKIFCQPNENIEQFYKDFESDLNKIPPEDRHNSIYYFVKGLYLKCIGDLDGAEKTIKHALSLTPNFVEAKRELNIIAIQKKSSKPVDILNGNLSDVVGLLFKKKK